MNKQEIDSQLQDKHREFIECVSSLLQTDYGYHAPQKWSAGQQMEHIYKSVRPVVLAFRLPTFVLGWVFGKANHPSKSYDELVAKYKARLAAATVQPPRQFQPKTQPFENRAKLAKDLQRNVEKLSQLLQTKPETLLDSYVLPHPLLGKLTLREMLYFTIYHVQHHQTLIQKNLSIK